MSETKTRGHCYCGAVKFEISGEPIWVSHCHCESCRRHTASIIATFAGFNPDQVSFTGNLPAKHSSKDGVKRSFCGQCGSPISYESDRWKDQLHMYLGIFDEPEKLHPTDHVYYDEKIAWLHVADGLPHHKGSGDGN